MIPRRLEELIWEGRGRNRSWATGGAGVFRIPVQKNTFIIVYQITWHPYLPIQQAANVNLASFINDSRIDNTSGLFLYTTKNRWYHNFRANYSVVTNPPGDLYYPSPGAPVVLDTYFVANENVRGNVCRVRNEPELWANTDFTAMRDESDELGLAQGYGTVSTPNAGATLKQWSFPLAGDAAIYPTADQSPLAPVSDQDASYEFQNMTGANIQILNPNALAASEQNGMNYPLINFQYVEISGVPPEGMF